MTPLPPSVRVLLALACLIAPAAPAMADDAADVRATARRFFTALLNDDLAAARAQVIESPADRGVLEALVALHAAERRFCDAFKDKVGSDPTTAFSTRRRIKSLDDKDLSVEFGQDTAWTFFSTLPFRKVDGAWKLDLTEYNHARGWTEQIPLLRARAGFYDDAVNRLPTVRETSPSAVEAVVDRWRTDFDKQHKPELDADEQLRARRCLDDLQGRWRVTVEPAEFNKTSSLQPFTATLTVAGKKLTVESPHKDLNADHPLAFMSFEYQTFTVGGAPASAQWGVFQVRVLGELRGTLTLHPGANAEFYTLTGTPEPPTPNK